MPPQTSPSQEKSNEAIRKMTEAIVVEVVRKELKGGLFTDRKLTDTPTDDLMVVNRKYVNLNGATASRPTSSILGQFYFDTTLGYPVWWNGSTWVKSDGTGA